MFDPNNPDYARNANGTPEYDSVTVTIDSVTANAPDADVVSKFVFSTQSAVASLMALFGYYNEHEFLAHSPKTIEMLQIAGREQNPIYVYMPGARGIPVCTQIIMSVDTFMGLVEREDFGNSSFLLTCEKLEETVARLQQQIIETKGGFAPLFFFAPSIEKGPAELVEDPAPGLAEELANGPAAKADTAEGLER